MAMVEIDDTELMLFKRDMREFKATLDMNGEQLTELSRVVEEQQNQVGQLLVTIENLCDSMLNITNQLDKFLNRTLALDSVEVDSTIDGHPIDASSAEVIGLCESIPHLNEFNDVLYCPWCGARKPTNFAAGDPCERCGKGCSIVTKSDIRALEPVDIFGTDSSTPE